MVGWHYRFNGHEFEQTLGDGEREGSLVCCSPWACRELDTTQQLNKLETVLFYCVCLLRRKDIILRKHRTVVKLRTFVLDIRLLLIQFMVKCCGWFAPVSAILPLRIQVHALLQRSRLFQLSSVVSSSLRLHEPQYARLPCPSPTPGIHPNPCPLSQ